MKRWTKKDLTLLCGQIDHFFLFNRLYYSGETMDAALARDRIGIVLAGLRGFRSLLSERATRELEAAEHFRTHPEVYAASTPEMIARFTKLGTDDTKAADKLGDLIERIESEGLPVEVASYRSEAA